ncbi:MAG: DUF429 domain-containing protein [Alphaproteobacteria bacterium]|nr:DUF429 domain-containing protein [Alphaproteobacteria bacterium]
MLENTFIHLPGVGRVREREYWAQGIRSWNDLEANLSSSPPLFPDQQLHPLLGEIARSREALLSGNIAYFAQRLPRSEHYRIALSVPESTLFLDIETTGLSTYYDHITLVGGSVGSGYICYLTATHKAKIKSLLESAKCLVTFNGSLFDLKFLLKELPAVQLPQAHVDLRFLAARLGYRGGQKEIERIFQIRRSSDVSEVQGELAPVLWHEYQLGNRESAKKLVLYNQYDVLGMRPILDKLIQELIAKEGLPLPSEQIPRFTQTPKKLSWTTKRHEDPIHRIYLPKKIGGGKPKVHFKDLTPQEMGRKLRFVGIDLTGSESRPTGWCFLNGSHAMTKLLSSDEDILVQSLIVKPDVVSIDSPLSLPKGRLSVKDEDPGRVEFGIMRQCERELKRRGVNVYPALIPSMQNLTARGMHLANRFRAMGVPVIESYPGAAQDIMGLPRKRASLAQLKNGLAAFGLSGDFVCEMVSHDEVDAVTAAVVGLFFWAGKFEALGSEIEDYLIIPDLEVSNERWMKRIVIGISGPIAAGKTTAARLLETKGFANARFSAVLEELLKERRAIVTRKSLQAIGEEINKNPGQRWLAKKLAHYHGDATMIVIDGLRHPEDHASMVECFGPRFFHVHLSVAENTRRRRYRAMHRSVREFDRAITHPVEAKVEYLAVLAPELIENEGTIEQFRRRLDRFLSQTKRDIKVVDRKREISRCR